MTTTTHVPVDNYTPWPPGHKGHGSGTSVTHFPTGGPPTGLIQMRLTCTGTCINANALAGTIAMTLAAGTSTATGTGALSGTAAMLLAEGTSTMSGAGALAGTAAMVLAEGTCNLTAGSNLNGSLGMTLAAGTSTATGTGALAGTAAMVLAGGTSTATGAGALTGTIALVESAGTDTLTGTGALAGTVAMVLASGTSTLTGAGALAGTAAMVLTNGTSTLSGSGSNNTAMVGTPSQNSDNSSTNTLTITRTVTAGNSLVAGFTCDSGPGVPASPTITDTSSSSGSWSACLNKTDDTTSQQCGGVFTCQNIAGGTNIVFTLSLGAAPANDRTAKGFWIVEISGCKTTGGFGGNTGQNQASAGTGTDAVTSGNVTPSASPGMLIGFDLRTSGTTVSTAGTGFGDDGTVCALGLGGNDFVRCEHKQLSSTSAVAATFTQAANNRNTSWAVVVLSS